MTKTVRSIVDDLVQRRLWPVAVLLALAIVAVPVLLTKSSSHPSTAPAGVASGDSADIAAVDTATADTPASGRALAHLGQDDPFVQRGKKSKTPGASSAATSSTASSSPGSDGLGGGAGAGGGASAADSSSTSSAGSSGGGGVAASSSGTPDASTAPVAHVAPAKPKAKAEPKADTGPAVSLDLAFGQVNGTLVRHPRLTRFSALPMAGSPVAIFLGVEGKDTAVFLVSSEATPQGDGKCRPKPSDCQTVRMRPGETEFFQVTPSSGSPSTYRMDLKSVHVRRTKPKASAASAGARARTAAAVRPPRKASWGKLIKRLKLSHDAGFGDVAAGLDAAGAQVGASAAP